MLVFKSSLKHCANTPDFVLLDPSYTKEALGRKKLTQPGQILTPPSCFVLWVVHSNVTNIEAQANKHCRYSDDYGTELEKSSP